MAAHVRPLCAITTIVMCCVGSAVPAAQDPLAGQGRIESFYFDMGGYTEVWVNVTPPPRPGDPISAIRLNFTVRYKGRPLDGVLTSPPLAVIVRAEANDLYNPTLVRQPILTMQADGELLWDPRLPVNFSSSVGIPCETCATLANTVDVTIPVDALERVGSARKVTGNALGFEFDLSQAQIDAIGRLTDRVFGTRP